MEMARCQLSYLVTDYLCHPLDHRLYKQDFFKHQLTLVTLTRNY